MLPALLCGLLTLFCSNSCSASCRWSSAWSPGALSVISSAFLYISFVGSSLRALWKQDFALLKYSSAFDCSRNRNPCDVNAFPRHHKASCFLGLIFSAASNFFTARSIISTASEPFLKWASSSSAPPQRVRTWERKFMFAREGVYERSATYLGIRWVFIVIRFGTLACFLEENHAFQLLPWKFHRSHIQPSLRHSEGEGRGRGWLSPCCRQSGRQIKCRDCWSVGKLKFANQP